MKPSPDVENKSITSDHSESNDDCVIVSEKSLNKQVRKQTTILDFCKPLQASTNNSENASVNVANNPKIESMQLPTTGEESLVGGKDSPVSMDDIGVVDSRKRRHVALNSPSPDEVPTKVQKKRHNETISTNNGNDSTVFDSTSQTEEHDQNSTNNCSDRDSPVSVSSVEAVKSRERRRVLPKSTPPTDVSIRVQKKQSSHRHSMKDNTRKSVSKTSRQSLSKTSNVPKNSSNNDATNDAEEEYIVEKVVGLDIIENVPHFHIKWKGYSAAQNTWEPLKNLSNCHGNLRRFLVSEAEANQTTIESILSELNGENESHLSDEDAFRKLKDFDAIFVLTHLILLAMLKDSNDESYKVIHSKLQATDGTILLPFWNRRNEQLKDLEEWQNDINKSDKSSQITVENLVDFEQSPSTFEYINDCIAGNGVTIPDDPLIGCDCKNGCSLKSNCCGKQLGSEYAYTSVRAIRLPQGNAVFECNKLCKCGPECTNRVVQQGRKHSLTIFKTSNGRGWGVRTDRVIAKGQYICEYVGEIITNKEAEARGHIYDAEKRTYLFDLDCNSIVENKENLYTIDACKMGNVSRMINHSCDPNIGTWSVWINCLDLDIPKICFYALRRIEAGEELSFDYLNFSVHDVDNKMDDDLQSVKTNFECKCGSTKCRKYIFDPSLLNPIN